MIKYGLFMLLTLLSVTSSAEIYKWTDSSGVVHYSDSPHQGASPVNLPEVPISVTSSPPASNNQSLKPLKKKEKALAEYESITIIQPKNEETIRNNQGYVPVISEISPDIRTGDAVQLLYDDKLIGEPQTSLVFTLKNVNRGAHRIAVQVVDASGAVLAKSENITFYMHRPRVNMGKKSPG